MYSKEIAGTNANTLAFVANTLSSDANMLTAAGNARQFLLASSNQAKLAHSRMGTGDRRGRQPLLPA